MLWQSKFKNILSQDFFKKSSWIFLEYLFIVQHVDLNNKNIKFLPAKRFCRNTTLWVVFCKKFCHMENYVKGTPRYFYWQTDGISSWFAGQIRYINDFFNLMQLHKLSYTLLSCNSAVASLSQLNIAGKHDLKLLSANKKLKIFWTICFRSRFYKACQCLSQWNPDKSEDIIIVYRFNQKYVLIIIQILVSMCVRTSTHAHHVLWFSLLLQNLYKEEFSKEKNNFIMLQPAIVTWSHLKSTTGYYCCIFSLTFVTETMHQKQEKKNWKKKNQKQLIALEKLTKLFKIMKYKKMGS